MKNCTVYVHDMGIVRISDAEADRLRAWEQLLRYPCGIPADALADVKRKHDLKMADIGRVARWKFENGHD